MILIDTAAGSSPLLDHPTLSALSCPSILPSPPFSSTRADVAFTGRGPSSSLLQVGIEVKRLTELATSLLSGRLQATQLPGLLHCYDVRWLLIVTGTSRRNPRSGVLQTRRRIKDKWEWADWTATGRTVPYNYVLRFLLSPSFTEYKDSRGEGVRFDRVYNLDEAASWILDLYETWQKPYQSHASMRAIDRSGTQSDAEAKSLKARFASSPLYDPRMRDHGFAQRVKTAASLPHVGYERAVAMAEAFPSVQKMVSPLCTCEDAMSEEERRARMEEEIKVWSSVRTVDPDTGKGRKLGTIGREIMEAVR